MTAAADKGTANRFDLHAWCRAVAKELAALTGLPWQGGPDPDCLGSDWEDRHACLTLAGRYAVRLAYHHDDGRVTVRGRYPEEPDGRECRGDGRPRAPVVTVDAARGPGTVARDLNRRFLPLFMQQHAAGSKQALRLAALREEQNRHTTALAEAAGVGRPGRASFRFDLPGGSGEVEVAGTDFVSLKVRAMSAAKVRELLRALKDPGGMVLVALSRERALALGSADFAGAEQGHAARGHAAVGEVVCALEAQEPDGKGNRP